MTNTQTLENNLFEWIIVGAGPAGIAGLGKLLDAGVPPAKILWIDPLFKVGDFGSSWKYISSNTPVEGFTKFFHRCQSFAYKPASMIDNLPPEKNCPLILAAQPLQTITNHLKTWVQTKQQTVVQIQPVDPQNFLSPHWKITLHSGEQIQTKKLLLAMGGQPKEINFPGVPSIPLSIAMDPNLLKKSLSPEDTVMLFGSAQSAKSILGHLKAIKLKKKVLFYRSSTSFDRHIDSESLEGVLALKITPKNLLAQMPSCTKTISAIGFKRRHIPILGLPEDYSYDQETGEIAPGIFGLGMAFPNIMYHELGLAEYRVAALWPVMKRLEKLLPEWLSSPTQTVLVSEEKNMFKQKNQALEKSESFEPYVTADLGTPDLLPA